MRYHYRHGIIERPHYLMNFLKIVMALMIIFIVLDFTFNYGKLTIETMYRLTDDN